MDQKLIEETREKLLGNPFWASVYKRSLRELAALNPDKDCERVLQIIKSLNPHLTEEEAQELGDAIMFYDSKS